MRRTAGRPAGLLDLLQRRFGLEFPPHRWERVVDAARVVTGEASPEQAARALAADDDLVDALVARVTVGETYFFREPDQFRAIGEQVLPDVRRRRGDDVVRAWSAGCASGEEAYSLAMALVAAGLGDRARVLATDVSSTALGLARRATYGSWSLRGAGAMRALPFLEARGRAWTVTPHVRRLVDVRRLNLASDEFPPEQDLILCRNVLIYLERQVVARVAQRLFAALTPGGWLLTASTDPRLHAHAPFEPVVTRAGTLYRRPLRAARSAAPAVAPARPAERPPRPRVGGRVGPRRRVVVDEQKQPRPQPQPTPPAEPVDPVEVARAAASRGDLDGALRIVDDLLRRRPLGADPHLVRGVVLLSQGRADDAIAALQRAVYLEPSLVMGHFSLGIALERADRPAEARRAYAAARRAAARLRPDDLLPHADGARAAEVASAADVRVAALDDSGGRA